VKPDNEMGRKRDKNVVVTGSIIADNYQGTPEWRRDFSGQK